MAYMFDYDTQKWVSVNNMYDIKNYKLMPDDCSDHGKEPQRKFQI